MPANFRLWLKRRRPVFSARAHRRAHERTAELLEHTRTSRALAADSSERARKLAAAGSGEEAGKQRAAAAEFGRWGAEWGNAARQQKALAESKKPWRLVLWEALSGKRKK